MDRILAIRHRCFAEKSKNRVEVRVAVTGLMPED
jgi:hypothetical protein